MAGFLLVIVLLGLDKCHGQAHIAQQQTFGSNAPSGFLNQQISQQVDRDSSHLSHGQSRQHVSSPQLPLIQGQSSQHVHVNSHNPQVIHGQPLQLPANSHIITLPSQSIIGAQGRSSSQHGNYVFQPLLQGASGSHSSQQYISHDVQPSLHNVNPNVHHTGQHQVISPLSILNMATQHGASQTMQTIPSQMGSVHQNVNSGNQVHHNNVPNQQDNDHQVILMFQSPSVNARSLNMPSGQSMPGPQFLGGHQIPTSVQNGFTQFGIKGIPIGTIDTDGHIPSGTPQIIPITQQQNPHGASSSTLNINGDPILNLFRGLVSDQEPHDQSHSARRQNIAPYRQSHNSERHSRDPQLSALDLFSNHPSTYQRHQTTVHTQSSYPGLQRNSGRLVEDSQIGSRDTFSNTQSSQIHGARGHNQDRARQSSPGLRINTLRHVEDSQIRSRDIFSNTPSSHNRETNVQPSPRLHTLHEPRRALYKQIQTADSLSGSFSQLPQSRRQTPSRRNQQADSLSGRLPLMTSSIDHPLPQYVEQAGHRSRPSSPSVSGSISRDRHYHRSQSQHVRTPQEPKVDTPASQRNSGHRTLTDTSNQKKVFSVGHRDHFKAIPSVTRDVQTEVRRKSNEQRMRRWRSRPK